ncbi:MAG: hypothetical protein LUC27_02910, partial [Lachnospiraceae bacterium]|nr:hypothetical protein [Lachnospiraceae bacterium]
SSHWTERSGSMATTDKEKAQYLREQLKEIEQLTKMNTAEMRDYLLKRMGKDRGPTDLATTYAGIVGQIGGIAYCALMETEDYT